MTSTIKRIDVTHIVELGDTNYARWRLQITLLLKSHDLWEVVNGTTQRPADEAQQPAWDKKDIQAQSIIVPTLSATQTNHIYDCATSKAMFDKLKSINSDSSSLNKQHTMARFFNYKIGKSQSLIEAFAEVEELGRRLNEMGVVMPEASIVTKIVSSLPDEEYNAFKKAWDSVPDKDQSMIMLLARLKKEELERKESKPAATNQDAAKAFLTHDQKKDKKKQSIEELKKATTCHGCGKKGHWKRECRSNPQNQSNKPSDNPAQANRSPGKAFMLNAIQTPMQAPVTEQVWLSDSGANQHVCGDKAWFTRYEEFDTPKSVFLTDKRATQALGKGTVTLDAYINGIWEECTIDNVLYIQGAVNLFSEGSMAKKGYSIVRDKNGATFYQDGRFKGPIAEFKNDMYVMKFRPTSQIIAAYMHPVTNAKLWHQRLTHINMNYVVDSIKKDADRGIDLEAVSHKIMCEDCEIGKQSRKPFPAATRNATIKPGEMVHMDLAGKMPVASLGRAQYFLLLKDDATGFRTVYFLKSKDEAKDRIKCYIEFMENQTGRKVKICRSDNGGEFCNSTLASYFRDRGIIHETTVSYNPEMNGRSEREIRTLKDCARTILLAAKLPESLWAEAVATTVYVHNRILDKQSPNITAFEAIFGKKPSLRHLRVFGSVAFAHIPAQKRTVWGAKGERLILCGYASESKKYRLYDPESGQVVEARNVSFHEEAFEPTVMIHGEEERDEPDESKSEKDDAKDDAQDDAQDDAEWTDEEKYDPEDPQPDQVDPQPVQPDNEKMGDELEVQVKTEKGDYTARIPSQGTTRVVLPETSKKSGTTRNLRDRAKIKKPDRYQAHAIYADKEPSTYKEAVESKEKEEWIKAMQDEIESHKKNGTWKYVKRSANARLLDSKWVYKLKRKMDGTIDRFKARLVIRGHRQKEGVDYFETFSAVSRYGSIRLLLSIGAAKKMHIAQLDVQTAYLYGILKETIYMSQPEGFHNGDDSIVCLLIKALYGLKQAGRTWNETFTEFLEKFDLHPCYCDPCIFVGDVDAIITYLSLWVDDSLVIGKDKNAVQKIINAIKSYFEITIMEPIAYVGMQIIRDGNDGLLLSQPFYIRNLLEKYNILECNPTNVPMQPHAGELVPAATINETLPYRQRVGSLIYLAKCTRPDISYAVSRLSQFMHAYDETHWKAAKQVLRYLKGTEELGIKYKPCEDMILRGYTDADYASDKMDRKSTTGFVFMLNDSVISWSSQKQPIVSMSSMESEYISLASGAREAVWLRRFLEELGFPQESPKIIHVDNQSAIKLVKNPEMHSRSKHIDVRYHYTRELVSTGQLAIEYVHTSEQIADGLSKPLLKTQHFKMRQDLSMERNETKKSKDNPTKVKRGPLQANFSLMSLLTILLMFITQACGVTHQNAIPLLWKKSPIPVTTGYNQVHLLVKFMNPCEILTQDLLHKDLSAYATEKCNKIYDEMFLDELEKMCPKRKFSDHINSRHTREIGRRVKRVLPLLAVGVIIGVTVLVAGLSVGGAINSFVQTGRISALQGTVAEQREMLDELERRVEISEREIEKLKVSLNATLEQLQLHQLDHDELKGKSIDTNFAIAYLTSRLMIGREIIREATRQWRRGKVYAPLMDFFNFTLPCGDACPVSFAQSQKCEISDDRTKLYVDFTATEINKDLQLIEADSFDLKVERKNETCVLKYKGPHNAILSTKDDCVYSINVKEPTTPDLIVSPTRGCTPTAKTKNSNHFDIDHCYDKNLAEPWDFVQIKLHHGQYHIYCPGSNITIERKLQQCPASVFILPMNANFKINDIEFSGTESSLVHQEVVDPLFTMKANWHLQPSFNWTSLMINGSTDEGGSIHYHTSNEPAWSTMEWILTLCILIIVAQATLCVFLFLKSRPNRDSARAYSAKNGRSVHKKPNSGLYLQLEMVILLSGFKCPDYEKRPKLGAKVCSKPYRSLKASNKFFDHEMEQFVHRFRACSEGGVLGRGIIDDGEIAPTEMTDVVQPDQLEMIQSGPGLRWWFGGEWCICIFGRCQTGTFSRARSQQHCDELNSN
ncbi:Copia protein [Folsomia candida]|uniref:Copia protein n=1 Tax=Folsomia candida TaxID=158441 RepID=A0A226DW10_FOLCA|nr:Copia protein [Folsomia candida]